MAEVSQWAWSTTGRFLITWFQQSSVSKQINTFLMDNTQWIEKNLAKDLPGTLKVELY
jgi:hypothetical protein